MSPSSLSFNFTPIWIQIHDLSMDWRVEVIARRIISQVGTILEVDKLSLSSGSMRTVRIRDNFEIAKALVPSAWIPFKTDHV